MSGQGKKIGDRQICNTTDGICPACQTLRTTLLETTPCTQHTLSRSSANYPVIYWRDLLLPISEDIAAQCAATISARLQSVFEGERVPVHYALIPCVDGAATRVKFLIDFPWPHELDAADPARWQVMLFVNHVVDLTADFTGRWEEVLPSATKHVNLARLEFFGEKYNPSVLEKSQLRI
ncbi:hypothetical protein BJY01DRAFT_256132 [Aspergillus pseudoustus]|uniref:Uncharacterized protein n=1 Tax=Aspergillus pseudoustus TaxID=1810923 RepID=A0ABR4IDR6_9EURO